MTPISDGAVLRCRNQCPGGHSLKSHIVNMLLTALILSGAFHALYYDRKAHRWHHHFLLYFSILFVGGVVFAWVMLLTEPAGYY